MKSKAKKQATCVELQDLIRLVKEAKKDWDTAIWARGQVRVGDCPLVPSVFRPKYLSGKGAPCEPYMIRRFLEGAPSRYKDCPPMSDYAGWYSLMQHYYLPTRLLDWTGSVLAATFFAVSEGFFRNKNDRIKDVTKEDGVVWVLSPEILNRKETKNNTAQLSLGDEEVKKLLPRQLLEWSGIKQKHAKKRSTVYAVTNHEISSRAAAQQSVFTVHNTATPLEELRGHEAFLRKYIIPAPKKKALRDELRVLGIRQWTLFPDLEGLAKDLAESYANITAKKYEDGRKRPRQVN